VQLVRKQIDDYGADLDCIKRKLTESERPSLPLHADGALRNEGVLTMSKIHGWIHFDHRTFEIPFYGN
jgi:hypothetical protein